MKILLLGLTGSGKSTLAKRIAYNFKLQLIEADDEVIKMNTGVWPDSENETVKCFEIINLDVIGNDNVIYVISWMEKERLKQFRERGFFIIELHADLKELINRKIKRDSPSVEELDRFKTNYDGYFEVTNDKEIQSLVLISVDTTNYLPYEVYLIVNSVVNNISQRHTR